MTAAADSANDKLYIHELVAIRGHNRARYMHHMTANWVPVALRERNQRCFGVWGTVGSTGRWPEVVNLWELAGWDGLVANFAHELSHASLQDPSLAEWWSQAARFRRGGFDRICIPAPWTRPIDALVAARIRGEVYVHELVKLAPGRARDYLDALRDIGVGALRQFGFELVAALRVALVGDRECIAIWAVPSWSAWSAFEQALDRATAAPWRDALEHLGAVYRRTLMVAAPLSPLCLGRQPNESDRRPLDEL